MTADSGEYPKSDGDIYYGKDANIAFYQGFLSATLNFAAVSVTTSDTVIKAANASRKSILLCNNGAATAYIGTTGVAVATGFPLESGRYLYLVDASAVDGITSAGTADIRYWEVE